jgi:thymidine phosphorylase
VLRAERDGYVSELDAYGVGVAAWRLGAGRARKEDAVQAGAGVELAAVRGERVTAGQVLAVLHTDTPERIPDALAALRPAFTLADGPASDRPLVLDRVSDGS